MSQNTARMQCTKCGEAALESVPDVIFDAEVKGEEVHLKVPGLRCPKCSFETMNVFEMGEPMRLAADEYRGRHGLLTSDELRARRGALGMSQAEFAKWVGVGVASVKRWELGLVQDAAMDKLLRVHTEIQELDALRAELRRHRAHGRRPPQRVAPVSARKSSTTRVGAQNRRRPR